MGLTDSRRPSGAIGQPSDYGPCSPFAGRQCQDDARLFGWLEDLRRDGGYGLRTLARTPAFTAAAIRTLALGIGAVTIIYSAVRAIVLDPFPCSRSDRLVNVVLRDESGRQIRGPLPGAGVPRLSGAGGRVRKRRRHEPRRGALDETLARTYFRDTEPLGRTIQVPRLATLGSRSHVRNRRHRARRDNTSPYDAAIFAGAAAVIVAIGGLACWIPARRAVRVEPAAALRHE